MLEQLAKRDMWGSLIFWSFSQPGWNLLPISWCCVATLAAPNLGRWLQVIARFKRHQWSQQVFRGSFEMLMVHFKITAITTTLYIWRQILKGEPLFEVVGPWPHDI